MTEFLVITVVLLGLLYVHKSRENKDLEYEVRLHERIARYRSLSDYEKLKAVREWMELYRILSDRVIARNRAKSNAFDNRETTVGGRVVNEVRGMLWYPRSIGNMQDDEKEMWMTHALLTSIDLPRGLADQELEFLSSL